MIPAARLLLSLACLGALAAPARAEDTRAGERKFGFCIACHGVDGRSFKTHYPILAGQAAAYLALQLNDFRQGRRRDANMTPIAAQLTDEDVVDLAAFLASRPRQASGFRPDAEKAARGKAKARAARCAACHPANGRLRGQHYNYVVKRLQDFREAMHPVAPTLTDADIEDLANYYAAMNSGSEP